jgi:hypothetical protein
MVASPTRSASFCMFGSAWGCFFIAVLLPVVRKLYSKARARETVR